MPATEYNNNNNTVYNIVVLNTSLSTTIRASEQNIHTLKGSPASVTSAFMHIVKFDNTMR